MNFNNNNIKCGCGFNIKTVGVCDVTRLDINGSNRANLNWTEISVPEILCIPEVKPDIEAIDQVYANVILDNIKLIQTPFAYREYLLYSFYTSVTALTGTLPALITTLTGTINAIIAPLNTTVITAFNTLQTGLSALTAITGVPALITLVDGFESDITTLISNLTTANTAVVTASTNLLAAITTLSPEAICEALQELIDALDVLNTLVNSVEGILNGMITDLDAADAAIPDLVVSGLITTATAALTGVVTTLTATLVPAATAAITAILNALGPIDCANSTVFVLINNEEGTCLSGRKLIVEGVIKQKIVYTAEVETQSVHSAHYEMPFISYIIPYAKFENAQYQENLQVYDPVTDGPILVNGFLQTGSGDIIVDLEEEFNVEACIEDIYVYALDNRKVFKNVTLFLKATPIPSGTLCN